MAEIIAEATPPPVNQPTPEQMQLENALLRNELLSRDLATFEQEIVALTHEVTLRNAIIVNMMDGKARTILLKKIEKTMGTVPEYTQTKTLLKLGLPVEE